jgi:uncharacterized protein YbbC (DUF1343 family)
MKKFCILLVVCLPFFCRGQVDRGERIVPGAERMPVYLPMLTGKRVALFANQTSRVGSSTLLDTLLKKGIRVVKIFSPEHGFRGHADAGESVGNQIDALSGLPIISLYGDKLKPSAEDLLGLDILIFDMQDVGVRFYTYLSSLQEYMEAALENGIPLLILDRPNPNGFYVDGPVLDTSFRSFVGMQPVPVVYGMTLGEYALMVAGEKWLSAAANARYAYYLHAENSADTPFHFLVIKCAHYTHDSLYRLPVRPSPNLTDMQAVYLYPSLCFFEGSSISLGRGTPKPFQQFGHPEFPGNLYSFIPRSVEGDRNPPHLNQTCFGFDLSGLVLPDDLKFRLRLDWLLEAYRLLPDKSRFFLSSANFFNKLAGGSMLKEQLQQGIAEEEIRKSWEPGLMRFKKIREKYLLYPDFNRENRN